MSFLFNRSIDATLINTGITDSFGRLRSSFPYTLGDYKHLYNLDSQFIDYTSNGGTVSFVSNKCCARLETSTNSSSRAVHQSKMYHHYMPGKSQLTLTSFVFSNAVNNVSKRIGLFDDKNGIFLEQSNSGLSIVLRSSASGSIVNTSISNSLWNKDRCDGTGSSGFNLDVTKTQLFFIDFQWLGVGRIRCGFVHDGEFIVAHEFYNSNNLSLVYMSNPNLPVRSEIVNTGSTIGGYFEHICSTVISEGGYIEAGQDWSILSPSARSLAIGATLPVLAIRLKGSFSSLENRIIAKLNSVSIFTESANCSYQVVKLSSSSSLTGGTGVWTSVDSSSGIEYYATATGYSSPDPMDAGFATAASTGSFKAGGGGAGSSGVAKKNFIAQNFDSTDSEIYAVIVTNIDTKATNVSIGMQWREIF